VARWATVIVVIGLALPVLVGASATSASNSEIPAKAWSTNFCSSFGSWYAFVVPRTQAFGKKIDAWKANGQGTISKIRRAFIGYLQDSSASTDRMVQKVKAAGPPAVPNGAAIQAHLNVALAHIASVFDNALTQARKLPTRNSLLFLDKMLAIRQQVETGFTKMNNPLAGVAPSPAIQAAARASPACQKLAKQLQTG
jgi:hypothetical protein